MPPQDTCQEVPEAFEGKPWDPSNLLVPTARNYPGTHQPFHLEANEGSADLPSSRNLGLTEET